MIWLVAFLVSHLNLFSQNNAITSFNCGVEYN
jgi:hypothetical protein